MGQRRYGSDTTATATSKVSLRVPDYLLLHVDRPRTSHVTEGGGWEWRWEWGYRPDLVLWIECSRVSEYLCIMRPRPFGRRQIRSNYLAERCSRSRHIDLETAVIEGPAPRLVDERAWRISSERWMRALRRGIFRGMGFPTCRC